MTSASERSKFRPCIDLHDGKVKQIVGGSLRDDGEGLQENFVSDRDAAWFAAKYRDDSLTGGHVIKLGAGNDEAARAALEAYPGGLQIGGGITVENAEYWLDAGASQVIVTSSLFDVDGRFQREQLAELVRVCGKDRVVLDLSCRSNPDGGWTVAMNRWQTLTELEVTRETLEELASSCAEFLVHAADVEGKCGGIDRDLVRQLAEWSPIPATYAGGARSLDDLRDVTELSGGRVDLTIGSALDLFGGDSVSYADCVAYNRGE